MPLNLYVSPVEGVPQWFVATDHEGLSFSGCFEWAKDPNAPDDLRQAGYRLGYGEEVSSWRAATRDECMRVAWEALYRGD